MLLSTISGHNRRVPPHELIWVLLEDGYVPKKADVYAKKRVFGLRSTAVWGEVVVLVWNYRYYWSLRVLLNITLNPTIRIGSCLPGLIYACQAATFA